MKPWKHWMPACAGVTLTMLVLTAGAYDSLLPRKGSQPEFLPVDQAFEIQPLEWHDGKLQVSWRIAKGYYLYQERMKFTPATPATLKLDAPAYPPAEAHTDEHFGTMHVFRNDLHVLLPVGKGEKAPLSVTVVYQGCADAGLCYPPQTRTLEVTR
jgi:thiol:disulfide interchange protein DsbD